MSESTIVVRELGKMYHRVHEPPMLLREALFFMASRPRRTEEFWALHDVSFEVPTGETMGVLGLNGSGKSTLLQLVSGASFPTRGTVSTRGRIATLLALGAGLRLDMTGEENIIMNAGFLGLSPGEITKRMPAIIEFSELAHVIDTPVRFYSSGMTARLGFSIAINVSPDILIVDEVLSVGDVTFQGKCMEKILELKGRGTTIVYASQSPGQIAEFCTRAIWLDQGKVQESGAARHVAGAYMQALEARLERL
jgi:lipopolysaccharide transport system ATP-binding protein